MMKTAYTSCMDEKAIADAGAKPITQLLEQLTATFSSNASDWSTSLLFLQQIGIVVFVWPAVRYAPGTGVPYLFAGPDPRTFLGQIQHYENATLMQEYTEVLGELLEKLSPRKFNSTLKTAESVVEFEKNLAHINRTYIDRESSRLVSNILLILSYRGQRHTRRSQDQSSSTSHRQNHPWSRAGRMEERFSHGPNRQN